MTNVCSEKIEIIEKEIDKALVLTLENILGKTPKHHLVKNQKRQN